MRVSRPAGPAGSPPWPRARIPHKNLGGPMPTDTSGPARADGTVAGPAGLAGTVDLPPADGGPQAGAAALPAGPPAEAPGAKIGRYKLLQQIGAGGLGAGLM